MTAAVTGSDDEAVAAAVLARMRNHGKTLATAESLTGGLICASLTAVSGASEVVRGGIVAYGLQAKVETLGLPGDELRSHGVYSAWTAEAMAYGARIALSADYAVSCTGVAGPGDDEGVPAGTVYIAVASPDAVRSQACHFTGGRDAVRAATVSEALHLLAATFTS